MYVCPCVNKLKFYLLTAFNVIEECSRMFQKSPECSRMFQNVCCMYAECSRMYAEYINILTQYLSAKQQKRTTFYIRNIFGNVSNFYRRGPEREKKILGMF